MTRPGCSRDSVSPINRELAGEGESKGMRVMDGPSSGGDGTGTASKEQVKAFNYFLDSMKRRHYSGKCQGRGREAPLLAKQETGGLEEGIEGYSRFLS